MSHESMGERFGPSDFTSSSIRFARSESASRTASVPQITSLCPQRYLVALSTTMSAPSVSGFCACGERKVLSATRSAPCSWATAASARISVMNIIGLEGVSMKIIFVVSRIFASTSDVSRMSMYSKSMP